MGCSGGGGVKIEGGVKLSILYGTSFVSFRPGCCKFQTDTFSETKTFEPLRFTCMELTKTETGTAKIWRYSISSCVPAFQILANYFEVNDLFTWGYRFSVPNFQDSSPISPFSLHALYVLHPRTTEASGIFTTTGRILFYNNWKETYGKMQMHCSEFQQWLIHLNTHTRCEYRPYSLVPDPQISRKCKTSVIPERVI